MSTTMRDDGIIDVEKRKQSVEYTLGDPTVFPPEFLNWLKRYIEQSGIQLPASSIFGTFQAGGGSVRNLAPGLILPFAGLTPPPGSLAADGSSVSRATYAKLFDVIGTTYGAPTVDTFTLPDYRDRALYGAGQTLALGQTDGRPLGQRGPSHHHLTGRQVVVLQPGGTSYNILGDSRTYDTVTSGGGGQDTPAFAAVLYVITTG